ncbi:hypothetical protein H8S90_05455 [Olivibacter sp. SDN3]|uniref:hypothetical protein n=1 Tax=Olivibacter sp. SDN3 TaxID=2764720 RepID=UPI0016516B26|nr:hypothetical protein [Olivibacter sp. SDN3]QNL51038.1 hypothetical protein H8S90_05455 [Olivibacter sp. SDN3]
MINRSDFKDNTSIMDALATVSTESLLLIKSRQLHYSSARSPIALQQEEIADLIDVGAPYYALKDVYLLSGNTVAANISPEQSMSDEQASIATSEACRHLTILGSVACAMVNPIKSKHYYLVHNITFTGTANKKWQLHQQFKLFAECISFEGNLAKIKACMVDETNELICNVDVGFQVTSEVTFNKRFAQAKKYYLLPNANPYSMKNKLLKLRLSAVGATASLGEIKEQYCGGHFPRHPALPAPILLGALLDLCAEFTQYATKDSDAKLLIEELTLKADGLGFAGDTINLAVKQEAYSNKSFKLRCSAYSHTKGTLANVTAIVQAVRPSTSSEKA